MSKTNETNWLFFNAAMKSEWETQVMRDIEETTGRKISVTLTLPTEAKARECWEKNRDLKGCLVLEENDNSQRLRFPLPFEGVFIRRSSGTGHAQLLTWATWLGERPGLHLILPASSALRKKKQFELRFAEGSTCRKLALKQGEDGTFDVMKEKQLQPFINATQIAEDKDGLLKKVEGLTLRDQDDLSSHRIAFTFPVWLAQRILKLAKPQKDKPQEDKAKEKAKDKSGVENSAPDLMEASGEYLVPVRTLMQHGILNLVQPNNMLELAARIWGVKRFFYSRDKALNYPAEYRQNHPSFEKRICPIETPESELIGLALQIARGARVNGKGEIVPAPDEASSVGWGVSLIPHYAHNDGARNMLGAKNLRQAVPVAKREAPLVLAGAEHELVARMAPLARIGICATSVQNDVLTLGRNLLVAYLPWKGWNVDDAIVVREGIVNDMGIVERKRMTRRIGPDFQLKKSLPKGTKLQKGDVVAEFENFEGKSTRILYEDSRPATLVEAPLLREKSLQMLEQQIVFEIEQVIPLGVGDKLMGRHGNKGVVGKILKDNEMPRLADGTLVDILLNPHGVLSRMNPGQLLETQQGWQKKHPTQEEGTYRQFIDIPDLVKGEMTRTEKEVLVGYEYIVRLHHVPSLKAAARRGGASARYATATQQAVHGRAFGGGQRLGEMEVWALAAYDVPHVLEEMLGAKADKVWAMRSRVGEEPERGEVFNGFAQTLKDWLFALSLDLKVDDGRVDVSFLSSREEVVRRIGEDQYVRSKDGFEKVQLAQFGCHDIKHYYDLTGSYPVSGKSLQVGDYLAELGYNCSRPLEPAPDGCADHYRWHLTSNVDNVWVEVFLKDYKPDKTTLTVEIRPQDDAHCPKTWPEKVLVCKGNFGLAKGEVGKKKKLLAETILRQITDVKGRVRIGDFKMCCPNYPSKFLEAYEPFRMRLNTAPKSIFDEQIFGKWASAGAGNDRWGYISLPEGISVPYPTTALSWKQKDIVAIFGQEKMDGLPKLSVIPVLPIRYRIPYAIRQKEPQGQAGESPSEKAWVEKINACYQKVLDACDKCREALKDQKMAGDAAKAETVSELSKRVAELFSCLAERLEKKEGVLRHDGLGRRIDRSFRLVITPNPDLAWDQAGVPADVLWEVMGDCVEAWERSTSEKDHGESYQSAPKQEQAIRTTWQHTERGASFEDQRRRLTAYLNAHPDTVILLNRQPSLHRESIQAFHPVPFDPALGEVLRIPPLCCKGFAADFDGDEMVGHYPVSPKAQEEAQKLLPSRNLLSSDSGKPTAQYDRNFVSGLELIYERRDDMRPALETLLPEACCRAVLDQSHQPGAFGQQLIQYLCEKHPAEAVKILSALARLAYAMCTRQGMSFTFQDLDVLAKKSCTDQASVEQALQNLADEEYQQSPGLANIRTMVLSGANGKKQIHQIVGKRGRLDVGGLGYVLSEKEQTEQFTFSCSLVGGMSWNEIFRSSWNARSTMCDKKLGTGKAGDLTRRLVFLLWPRFGTEGLLAAQAIGERGTQVAMQGFHTGHRGIDIDRARELLLKGVGQASEKDPVVDFVLKKDFDGFLRAVQEKEESGGKGGEYAKVKEEHFKLLFDALVKTREAKAADTKEEAGAKMYWTQLFQSDLRTNLLGLALSGTSLPIADLPFTRVLFAAFGSREEILCNLKKGE